MKELQNLTDSEKIDYLINQVERIDRAVNPPVWKSSLRWFATNFWTLLFLAIIGYFLWQVWEVVQAVQTKVITLQTQVDGMKLGVAEQFKSLGQALSSVKEFDVNQLKFWE